MPIRMMPVSNEPDRRIRKAEIFLRAESGDGVSCSDMEGRYTVEPGRARKELSGLVNLPGG